MKKGKLYVLTFLVIAIVSTLAGLGALHYFYKSAKKALWEQKVQSGQREIRELGVLLEQQLDAGIPSARVIENLQQSIHNTDTQSEFVCMYNTEGIELCNPDPSLIGMKIAAGNSSFLQADKEESFQNLLKRGQLASGIRTFPENTRRSSEIVSVYPVKGTDWMLASHTNIKVSQKELGLVYQRFLTGSLLMIIILTGSCFWLITRIYRKYEKEVNINISGLNEEINTLGAINRQLEIKQNNTTNNTVPKDESSRKRLVTYYKDEIKMIDIQDIVYAVLDGDVSILTFTNKRYTINYSLDDLMKQLDNEMFYRANRQYIVNVNAIDSIWIYGRNQLHIETRPKCPEPIIISKNKVSEFKKWLDR